MGEIETAVFAFCDCAASLKEGQTKDVGSRPGLYEGDSIIENTEKMSMYLK